MKWLDKRVSAVLAKWKRNEIGLSSATQELTELGYAPLVAWSMLENL